MRPRTRPDIALWDLHCHADSAGLFCSWTPEPTTGCYLWTGRYVGKYGMVSLASRSLLAHRCVYRLVCEDIAPDIEVHHTCESPGCVNPRHLVGLTPGQHRNVHTGRGLAWVHYYGSTDRNVVDSLDAFDAGCIGVPFRPVVFALP